MKSKYLVVVSFGILLILGNGCIKNEVIVKDTVATSTAIGGVSLYVNSLEQSSKDILEAGKEFHVIEYKSLELTEKNKIKILFLTIPNNQTTQFETVLAKEATDKIVWGAKNLYGDFLPEERSKNGTTNFEIRLIDVSILK